jgi:hypothetical protein
MKKLLLLPLIFFLISTYSSGQHKSLSSKDFTQLDLAEKEMVNALSNGDSTAFKKIAGDEYIDINANGTTLTLKGMLLDLPNYKGLSVNFSEQSQRVYGTFVLRTGRAKLFSGGQQVGEVFYTQGWIYRNKRWQFVHWQGTMTKDFLQKK